MNVRRSSWWRYAILANAGLLMLIALIVLAGAFPSTEAARLRNALLLDRSAPSDFTWIPPKTPAGFKLETGAASPEFLRIAHQLGVDKPGADWDRARTIAAHLTRNAQDRGAIQDDLSTTYHRIVEDGRGYCVDFTTVYMALAIAAGIPVRQWAFSFDGFGGHGHAFVEIYDAQRGKWLFLDVYDNFYAVDPATGEPLSALEYRDSILGKRARADLPRIGPGRPGFAIEEKEREYYRAGVAEWYLWWGNNVYANDRLPTIRALGDVSRAGKQFTAMVLGLYPSIRILETAENADRVKRVWRLKTGLLIAAGAWLCLLVLLVVQILTRAANGSARERSATDGADSNACSQWVGTRAIRDGRSVNRVAASHVSAPRGLIVSTSPLKIGLVGPSPPPEGGMANQCRQLADLLRSEGLSVEHVRTNAPYRPPWIASLRMLRSLVRLMPFVAKLWGMAGRVDVVHVFANSGWAWHLCAAPAIWIARLRGTPVIVNYRGGEADAFLARAPFWVYRTLACADSLVAPSSFLQGVFDRRGLKSKTIPNIVDLLRFKPRDGPRRDGYRHIVVTRNLEPIYDITTAVKAFAVASTRVPDLRMTIAGTGPQRMELEVLAGKLGIAARVRFAGQIDNADIAALYRDADLLLNPSTVDNMPNSLLEAFASAVPVVSTDVGGIPFIARHRHSALLVKPREPVAMAEAIVQVLSDHALAERLARNGLEEAKRYGWPAVRESWLAEYESHLRRTNRMAEAG